MRMEIGDGRGGIVGDDKLAGRIALAEATGNDGDEEQQARDLRISLYGGLCLASFRFHDHPTASTAAV